LRPSDGLSIRNIGPQLRLFGLGNPAEKIAGQTRSGERVAVERGHSLRHCAINPLPAAGSLRGRLGWSAFAAPLYEDSALPNRSGLAASFCYPPPRSIMDLMSSSAALRRWVREGEVRFGPPAPPAGLQASQTKFLLKRLMAQNHNTAVSSPCSRVHAVAGPAPSQDSQSAATIT